MKRRAPCVVAGFALVLLAVSLVSPAAAIEEADRLWLVGERAFADGLYPAARRALERFAAQYPKDARLPEAVLLLGKARLQTGDAAAAVEAFKRAEALTPPPGRPQESQFWEAEALFRLKRFADARAAYDAVMRADAAGPLAPDALYGRSWSDLELKRPEAAVAGFREMVSAFPQHPLAPSATLQAARTLADTKKAGEALALLADFSTKYPASPLVADARFWSGWIKSTGSDPRGGVADLRAFLAASPNHAQAANARRLIAQSLARYGDRDELLDAYKTLMEQTPPTADALYNAAQIAMRLARPRDQEAAWKRLSAEFPEHPLTRRMALDLASAAFKQKSWKSAVTYATQAAHSDDDAVKSEAWLLVGESELKQKRFGPAAPSEKPAVVIDLPLPRPPVDLPAFPSAVPTPPAADKPTAFIQSPRALPCVGSWLGIATESLECGRARFQRGDFEDAFKALENAVRKGTDRELLREARYWLGETLWRLDRTEQADWLFRQVAQDAPRQDWGVWALHASGWTALRLREGARARDAFSMLLAGPTPSPLDAWGRHGLALSLYALGRWEEADKAWTQLESAGVPPTIARDVLFWHGDTLGRLGQAARAETMLRQFTQGGAHPLFPAGVLRLGWWALAAGHAPEAVAAFRAYSGSAETEWASAGLAQALLVTGDWAGARKSVAALSARRSPLAFPMLFRLARAAVDTGKQPVEAEPVYQELLGGQLDPGARAWVLMVKGEAARAQGDRDDARTQFELAQKVGGGSPAARQAAVRQARVDFELREYSQAVADLVPVLNARGTPEAMLPALLLQGEAAYQGGDFVAAGAAFRRMLVEFPTDAQAPVARTALAWTYLKQGRKADARRELLEVVRAAPNDPGAPDALLLASELALEGGDLAAGREMVERIVGSYPTHARADFARLNRGLALLREGDAAGAEVALRDWLGRAPFPALFGRAHAALGTSLLAQGKTDEALREFTLAQKDGSAALGQLGVASVALASDRRDDAERLFTAVRDAGTPDEAAAATYGLAVVAFGKGAAREFRAPAEAALAAAPRGPAGAARAAPLLYVLTGLAVDDKDWAAASALARRLVADYPASDVAPDALERVGAGAAAASAWPIALESTKLLRERYPQHPLAQQAWLRLAEAQIETGRAAEARPALEQYVASAPSDADTGRAWLALARAREAAGDRAGALEAYARGPRDTAAPGWTREALFGHARLLIQDKRWDAARAVLERLLRSSEPATAAEAAQALGDTYAGEGDTLAAVEYYLTAAYVAPDTPLGRRGLLSAARAFAAGKQPEPAAAVYKKLLALADLPAELRDAARQELAALARPAP